MPGASDAKSDRYSPLAQALHWLTALLVLGLIGVGLWMVALPLGLTKLYAYGWHKWIGLTVFLLTLVRLGLRAWRPQPPLPATVTTWERTIAPWSHAALLVLLISLPLTGWMMSSAGGVPVVWFGVLPLPDLVSREMHLFERLRTTHHWLAWTLMGLLAVHVLAVVHHDVVRRDGILRRMLPFVR